LVHDDVAFAGTAQGPQRSPHEFTEVSSAQTLPHAWKPVLHASPHVWFVHVARPLLEPGQGEQRAPQVATSSLDAQVSPHR
jgi:hypothetical protein